MDKEEQEEPKTPPKPAKTNEEYEKEIANTAERDKAIKERDEANTKIREQTDTQKDVDPFDELFGRAK